MGVGHVPPGPFPGARPGAHIQGCQRRGAGAVGALSLSDHRTRLARGGESLASWFLSSHGLTVIDSNVAVGSGELDLIALDQGRRVAIEVRSTSVEGDPIDRVDEAKRRRVRALASRVGANRVDYVGIRVDHQGFDVHWVPGVD